MTNVSQHFLIYVPIKYIKSALKFRNKLYTIKLENMSRKCTIASAVTDDVGDELMRLRG